MVSNFCTLVHLRVRQFFCFWKLFVALNDYANFFALQQTFKVLLDQKVIDLELFQRSALFTTAKTWRSDPCKSGNNMAEGV